jgi:hypothetical protein
MVTGSYVGNATAGRKITGVGFKPDVVIIKGDDQDVGNFSNTSTILRSSTMTGDNSKPMVLDNAILGNEIQSLDIDGFTVGSERRVNKAGTTFFWAAFKADADMKVGTYTGNGGSQPIVGVGFSPDYVIVMSSGARRAIQATTAAPVGRSFEFDSNVWLANQITSLDATGFTVNHNAGLPYANENTVVYHYVAWNNVALKTRVGFYNGNAADNRSITGVGFQPEYLIIKPIYNNNVGPTFTPPASQRFAPMTGDSMYNFALGPATDHIQAFEIDGFQIGLGLSVNRQAIDCNLDAPCAYFYVAFNTVAPASPPLTTATTATTVTITAPYSFELTLDTHFGGGVHTLYDLAEDPTRTYDFAGLDISGIKVLHHAGINSGGSFYTAGDNTSDTGSARWIGSPPLLDVLESTPVRVRVRQNAFFQQLGANLVLPLKHIGDYSIYPHGRLVYHLERRASASVAFTEQDLAMGTLSECPASCASLTPYTQGGLEPFPEPAGNAGTEDFVLLQREQPGRRTDLLNIMATDWADANRVGYDQTVAFITWRDVAPTNPQSPQPVGSRTWNFMTYFKPTNFATNADVAVSSRSTDYRGPAALAVTLPATVWNDAAENTAADSFNEAEGAYTLNVDPATGITFDIGGTAALPRYKPFFKMRRWRSLGGPTSVSLEGAGLVADVDFRAAVKPVARAHFGKQLWYSTMQTSATVTTPAVGTNTTTVNGTTTFVAGRYGNGALFNAVNEYVRIPAGADFDKTAGAVEFWYQPTYVHTDNVMHVLFHNAISGAGFALWKQDGASGNKLTFTINDGVQIRDTSITSANYSWRISDWVHIRAVWNDGAMPELWVNGQRLPHTDTGPVYNAAAMTAGPSHIGADIGGNNSAMGIIDEFHIYGGANTPQSLAHGGVTTEPDEYLASGSQNFSLGFTVADARNRGEYVYFGADSKFRGLNLAFASFGTGAGQDVEWFFWNGTAWVTLEAGFGFTDQTNHLKSNGSVFWTSDPTGWAPYSVNGGPDLYYVRAHLEAAPYGSPPIEAMIKTDILLFQYTGDIVAAAQTFVFAPPITTEVELSSFTATGEDGAVAVSWTTASELHNLGFHLYRSTSAAGPFERVTASVIPGLGSSPSGASYSYRDSGLLNGVAYFYQLEDVETTGHTKRHGPVSATPQAGLGPAAGTSPPSDGTAPPASSARITYGDPSRVSLRVMERGLSGALIELVTGGFYATPQRDGTVHLEVPGFDELSSPGSPALPVKRTWLEAVAGRGVRIASVRPLELSGFTGLRPSNAGTREVVVSPEGLVRAGSRRARVAWRGAGVFPASPALVVESGFQGEVKKALIELSPMRWDGRSEQLLLARRLLVRVSFTGVEPSERSLGGARGRRHHEDKSHGGRTVLARLHAAQRGLYRVSFEEIFGARGRLRPATSLRLSRQGEAVAYYLEPPSGSFGPGSALYFMSAGSASNPYANEAVYELEQAAGGRVMATQTASPWGAQVGSSVRVGEWEQNRYYQSGLLEAPSLWLWDVVVSPNVKSYRFTLSSLVDSPSKVSVWLQGASDFEAAPDHHVKVKVNGSLVGEAAWDGKGAKRIEGELGAGVLQEGENRLEVHNVGDTAAAYSMVFLDRFSVSHARQVVSENGVFEGAFSASGTAEVAGLGTGSLVLQTAPEMKWLRGALATATGLTFRAEAGRSYLAVSPPAVLRPQVKASGASGLRRTGNRADYLLIGPREFLAAAEPLLSRRRSQGLVATAVAIEDVYDEFGYGEPRAEAVKEFLAYAYHHWTRPSVRYVVLLGDATYDGKNYLGTGVANRVPALTVKSSYLWTASDPSYAAVNGEDLLPDLSVGRLPAANVNQARVLVEKVLAFEESGQDLGGPAVMVADNADLAGDFEADSEAVAAGLGEREVERIYLRELGTAQTRSAIVGAFDRGVSLLSYVGHGGIAVWASENVFSNQDVARLGPQAHQPILMTMNCLNGYFHFPPMNSLSEELLKAEGKGAVAAFSPSGLSLDAPAHVYHQALVGELVSGRHARLGDAVLAAQKAYADSGHFPELLQLYHLFGDPALTIR